MSFLTGLRNAYNKATGTVLTATLEGVNPNVIRFCNGVKAGATIAKIIAVIAAISAVASMAFAASGLALGSVIYCAFKAYVWGNMIRITDNLSNAMDNPGEVLGKDVMIAMNINQILEAIDRPLLKAKLKDQTKYFGMAVDVMVDFGISSGIFYNNYKEETARQAGSVRSPR